MTSPQKRRKVGLGLLGSGVVGEAVQDILFADPQGLVGDELQLELRKIYTRNPQHKKWYSTHPTLFTTNAKDVIDDPNVAILIEALGFQEPEQLQLFRDYILRAFRHGKSVVTSDKAVLAKFGAEIWSSAAASGQQIRFEACVGGGIPIIRSLSQSFAVEEPEAIFGIVNGTCNYILSEMEKRGAAYSDALREAQQKGYAETNPIADVSGSDAEAKLVILAAVTFGLQVQLGSTWRKGIEEIHAVDFRYAGRTGSSTIKHFAVAKRAGNVVQVFVSPVLIARDHFLASIDGATNAICFKGRKSGEQRERDRDYVLVGPGAGGGPTAVAILGDVYELARAGESRQAGLSSLVKPNQLKIQPENEIDGSFYLRFVVKDRAGIVGDIGQTFGRLRVNIAEIWQLRHSEEELRGLMQSYHLKAKPNEILPFVITLEQTTLGQIREAMDHIRRQDYILTEPVWFPIWGTK
jgi:homoserine dehydrogenase